MNTNNNPLIEGFIDNRTFIGAYNNNIENNREQEKINIFQEENQEQYTIMRQKEYCKKFKIDDSLLSVRTVRKKENKLIIKKF